MTVLIDITHPLWSAVERLSESRLVSAVALVGSHASGLHAPDSDYDVFIYTEGELADLRDHPYSFRHQLAQAIARHDAVSVNHRLAAWLGSYVDILFAVNRVLHPGEKRIVEFLARECATLPAEALVMIERLASVPGGVH